EKRTTQRCLPLSLLSYCYSGPHRVSARQATSLQLKHQRCLAKNDALSPSGLFRSSLGYRMIQAINPRARGRFPLPPTRVRSTIDVEYLPAYLSCVRKVQNGVNDSVVKSVKGLVKNIPALVTRRSIMPKLSIAAATTLAAVSFFPISPATRTRFDDAAKD